VDGAPPKIPPAGLFAAGVLEKSVDDPELGAAPPPPLPNNPLPGVLEPEFVLAPKMDDVPPEPAPAPKRGLFGVLLPPPACEKLKAIACELIESDEGTDVCGPVMELFTSGLRNCDWRF
jgi:hypothetical protein